MNEYIKNPLSKEKRYLILAIYFIGFQLLFPLIIAGILALFGFDNSMSLNFWSYFLTLIIVVVLAKSLYENEPMPKLVSMLKVVGICMLGTIVCSIIISFLIYIISGNVTSDNQNELNKLISNSNILSYSFMVVIMGPIVEETVFRGVVFRSLRSKMSFIKAALIAGLLFGFIHVWASIFTGNLTDLFYTFQYAAIGFFFAYAYEKTHSIKGAVLMHIIYNAFGLLVNLL